MSFTAKSAFVIAFVILALFAGQFLPAQTSVLLKQIKNDAAAQQMTAEELAELGDPLFNLVLRHHADETNLTNIENLIQPNAANRRLMVVDELIMDPRRGQSRRGVVSFTGTHRGEILDPNVMLSVFFNSEAFPEDPTAAPPNRLLFVEAWGWDDHRSRYNYYKLDRSGPSGGGMTWKFRGSSVGADQLTAFDRRGTCLQCHINGAPIMKELLVPWNNWHSLNSNVTYLRSEFPDHWPVAETPHLQRLSGARFLEGAVISAIGQFNRRRIDSGLARRDSDGKIEINNGKAQVLEGRRLLRHLFLTTEFNMISDRRKSRLHPIPAPRDDGPSGPVNVPSSFFLNANLIARGTFSGFRGLGIVEARDFSRLAEVTIQPAEYKSLILESAVTINGRVGDADFCWLVPEPSHIDNDMVDRLMKRGIVSPHFVAAVLTIDLKNPVLSDQRRALLSFVPNRFSFSPLADGDDAFDFAAHRNHDLTQKVIAAIRQASPSVDSPAGRFLSLLDEDDPDRSPLKQLKEQVQQYINDVKSKLADPSTRAEELKQLHQKAIAIRRAVLDDAVLGALDETGGRLLFPVP